MAPQHHHGTRLHTETVGVVVDRLAAAQVCAMRMLTGAAAAPTSPHTRAAWVHLAELADAYDDLAMEVVAGRTRLPLLGDTQILWTAPAG